MVHHPSVKHMKGVGCRDEETNGVKESGWGEETLVREMEVVE